MDNIQRGREAQQALNNSLYKEAHAQIEQNIVNELANADITPERQQSLRFLLIANRKHKRYLEQVMLTGKFEEEEAKRKSLLEEARDRIRRVF